MQTFSLGEEVVGERNAWWQGKVTCGYGKGTGVINSGIEWKLDSFDEVKDDGILKSTRYESVSRECLLLKHRDTDIN